MWEYLDSRESVLLIVWKMDRVKFKDSDLVEEMLKKN